MRSSLKKKRIGVLGAGGRMGREVLRQLEGRPELIPYLGIDSDGRAEGFEFSGKNLAHPRSGEVDLWIDFSSPKAALGLFDIAGRAGTAVVSGTTGFGETQKRAMKKASRRCPLLWSSNMSLGVAVLNEALKTFAHIKDFDFQIEEAHHRRKKDKPSGTALSLQESLESAVGRRLPEPLSLRGGGIYGIHKVWAMSEEETLIFEHSALNRAVFARGAVSAAIWLLRQKPGLYSLRDILYIR